MGSNPWARTLDDIFSVESLTLRGCSGVTLQTSGQAKTRPAAQTLLRWAPGPFLLQETQRAAQLHARWQLGNFLSWII